MFSMLNMVSILSLLSMFAEAVLATGEVYLPLLHPLLPSSDTAHVPGEPRHPRLQRRFELNSQDGRDVEASMEEVEVLGR